MKKEIFLISMIAGILLLSFSLTAAKSKPDTALLLFPAGKKININSGTLEVIFSLDYSFDDYLRPELSEFSPFKFIRVYGRYGLEYDQTKGNSEPFFRIMMYHHRGDHAFNFINPYYYYDLPDHYSDRRCFNGGFKSDKEKGIWISRGEWHSLAVTWKVDNGSLRVEMFLDGISRRVIDFTNKESSIRDFNDDDYIGIGDMDISPASILSYRLSNRVRTEEEITSKEPLKADDATTFFMNGAIAAKFKKYDRKKYFKMLKDQKIDVKTETFFGEFKIIDTPMGKAIQFYNKLSR
jgi:hypothetical protein